MNMRTTHLLAAVGILGAASLSGCRKPAPPVVRVAPIAPPSTSAPAPSAPTASNSPPPVTAPNSSSAADIAKNGTTAVARSTKTDVYVAHAFDSGPYKEPTFTPCVPDYAVSPRFSNVRNWKMLSAGFDVEERARLAKNRFLVLDANRHQMSYIYEENTYPENEKSVSIPSFVTTDAVLHIYHVFYDYLLRSVETAQLYSSASRMTRAMIESAAAQYGHANNEPVKQAALREIAYLLVPAKALKCDLTGLKIPANAGKLAEADWEQVQSHSGEAVSAILGYPIDFSQFIPRGHYTRSETLKRYFVAMMWYGSVPILVRDKTGGLHPDALRVAALLAEQFLPGNPHAEQLSRLYHRILDTTAFLVGDSDDYSSIAFVNAVRGAVKEKSPENATASQSDLSAMVSAAEKASPVRIVNGNRSLEIAVKLMGQRFVLDGFVMQNLVSPSVGDDATPRNHPMGLDLMAACGSNRAKTLLINDYKQAQYANFESQLAKMTDYVAGVKPATWTSNAYYGWLDVLCRVTAVKGPGYPSFMRSEEWTDKSLNTALASWAELRHDTILYSKQTAVEAGGEGGDDTKEKPPGGYAEPDIRAYARLQHVLRQLTGGLNKLEMVPEDLKGPCKRFDDLLTLLITVSRKELANQRLTDIEDDELKLFGHTMNNLTIFESQVATAKGNETYSETRFDADRDMASIADVHTDFNRKVVLEEGSGHANVIYSVFPAKGRLWIGRGAVFTYYEFEQPIADRLNDEEWQKMLKSRHAPQQPSWTKSYQINKPAPHAKLKINDDRLDDLRVPTGG